MTFKIVTISDLRVSKGLTVSNNTAKTFSLWAWTWTNLTISRKKKKKRNFFFFQLIVSRRMAKNLTVSHKSHHPIETLWPIRWPCLAFDCLLLFSFFLRYPGQFVSHVSQLCEWGPFVIIIIMIMITIIIIININHKNHEFLVCDWFKKLLFPPIHRPSCYRTV